MLGDSPTDHPHSWHHLQIQGYIRLLSELIIKVEVLTEITNAVKLTVTVH